MMGGDEGMRKVEVGILYSQSLNLGASLCHGEALVEAFQPDPSPSWERGSLSKL